MFVILLIKGFNLTNKSFNLIVIPGMIDKIIELKITAMY